MAAKYIKPVHLLLACLLATFSPSLGTKSFNSKLSEAFLRVSRSETQEASISNRGNSPDVPLFVEVVHRGQGTELESMKVATVKRAAERCQRETQVQRLNTNNEPICCNHVKCFGNQNFVPCKEHNTYDTCVGCGPGTCNGAVMIESKYLTIHDVCVPISSICDQFAGAKPVVTGDSCWPECVCDKAGGYYGFNKGSRGCFHTYRKCGKGAELSDTQDECVKCSTDKFKRNHDGICLLKTICTSDQIEAYPGSETEDRRCRSKFPDILLTPTQTDIRESTTITPEDVEGRPSKGESPTNSSSDKRHWFLGLWIYVIINIFWTAMT